MNKYIIYLNNGNTETVSSDGISFMGNITVFYKGDVVVASIPSSLTFFRVEE